MSLWARGLVGAIGFEPTTPCAQGMTECRYLADSKQAACSRYSRPLLYTKGVILGNKKPKTEALGGMNV